MTLPNWFKVVWWLLIAGTVTAYLRARYPDLVAGQAVPADIVGFVVWLALLLAPVFHEVEILGFKFKREVQKLREEVKSELSAVRSEIRNAVDIRPTFSPQFNMPTVPPDSQLPALEERVKAAVTEALEARGKGRPEVLPTDLQVNDDLMFLFATRYAIEREVRRIARDWRVEGYGRRPAGVTQLVRELVNAQIIDPRLEHAIREVYAVSSTAIHASEDVSEAQVQFVRDVAPELVATLRLVHEQPNTRLQATTPVAR